MTYSSPDELNSVTLDRIAALLSGVEWEASYLDDIAELVRFTGREIANSDDTDEPTDDGWTATLTRPPQTVPVLDSDIDRQYLTIDVPQYPGVNVPMPMSVSVKLDDEGVVIDIMQGDGQVVASTWKLYSDFGVIVVPDSREYE